MDENYSTEQIDPTTSDEILFSQHVVAGDMQLAQLDSLLRDTFQSIDTNEVE